MAVRKKHEDVVIGTFIIVSFLYPFFISVLIWMQENKEIKEDINRIKEIGQFLLGKIPCTKENAIRTRHLMSEILRETYSINSLIKVCRSTRVKLSEISKIDLDVKVDNGILNLYFKTNNKNILLIKAKRYDNKIEVVEFSYGKGS